MSQNAVCRMIVKSTGELVEGHGGVLRGREGHAALVGEGDGFGHKRDEQRSNKLSNTNTEQAIDVMFIFAYLHAIPRYWLNSASVMSVNWLMPFLYAWRESFTTT